ncbi:MAG: cupin domain-containing protein [Ignavibacteriae bacterium]|nr:cupin domain-containing protein [Ignavibacteria bacterium]MBI3364039.1 cupin domain-containing protein [Ignavibacteriota bacterium]
MNCELREYCSLYVLGLLTGNDLALYEKHLLQGCDECADELRSLGEAVEVLARTDARVSPRPHVKERLMARLTQDELIATETPHPGLFVTYSNALAWQETGVEGVQLKMLFTDTINNVMSVLVRMAPGASYPSHRHAHTEECLVLEGDLRIGDSLVLHAGDYQRADENSVHLKHWTEKGCLLYVTTSLENEMLQ